MTNKPSHRNQQQKKSEQRNNTPGLCVAATRSHRVESVAAFCKFNSCLVMLCTPIIRLLHSGQVHARAILLVLLKPPRQIFKKSTPGFLKITPPGIRQRPQHLRHSHLKHVGALAFPGICVVLNCLCVFLVLLVCVAFVYCCMLTCFT